MERAWIGGLVVGLFVLGALWIAARHEAKAPPPRAVADQEPDAEAGTEPDAAASTDPFPGARAVAGRATGRYGAIWGVRLTAYDARDETPLAQVATDRDGRYRLELDPGDPRVVDLVARRDTSEGVAVQARRGLSWDEPGEVRVDFSWPSATRSVGGWVLPPTHSGAIRLFAVPADAYRRRFGDRAVPPGLLGRVPKETATTDDLGLFEFTGLQPWRYRLVVGTGDLMCAEPVEFDADGPAPCVRVVPARGACVHVRDVVTGAPPPTARLVFDPGGEADARVVARGAATLWFREPREWDRGAWPLPRPPPEPQAELRVEADGYHPAEVPAYAGRSAHVVYLLPNVSANGRVTLRMPVDTPGPRRFSVGARHVASGKHFSLGESEDGVLETGLPEGTWDLSIDLLDARSIPPVLRRVQVGDSGRWEVRLAVRRRLLVDAD